ncbi:Pyridoxamine 5 -phosphate oxidase [Lecanosticta acicola]|uniref:Pyridoxamine 5 -phosphate oxidase n=1 Tax=Lecanosticta acicola TaxID=111012 RepID=A0AAI8W1D7_9PEZI|nr:Pyridoxamine 5 -phosphate oxidase [Lecanosticta acicola]
MAETRQTPLRWEQSAQPCNATTSDRLPSEVVTCLENARFLHLATCTANQPHVSLMNYTYLPSNPYQPSPQTPTIIMTSNPTSKKTTNLLSNPNVSLLVHDWVSTRPPTSTSDRERSPMGARSSSLAAMLMQMNSTAVSSISATINGEAYVLESGTEEEKWCKEQHLMNNTFGEGAETTAAGATGMELLGTSPAQARVGDSGKSAYIEDEEVRVVVVRIRDGRISDWKGGVKDWKISSSGGGEARTEAPRVNGVI